MFLIPVDSFQVLWDMVQQMLGMKILTSEDVCRKEGEQDVKILL